MREPIDHERCSELLAPFVRGELAAEEIAEVEAHLQNCSDCSEERDAVAALNRGRVPLLAELERARLRRVVLSEAVPLPEEGEPAATALPGPSRGVRLYRVLGAAALLAVIGGFAYLGLGGMSGGDDGAETASTGDAGGADSDRPAPLQNEAEARRQDSSAGTGGAASEALDTKAALAPSPTFEPDLGLVDEKRLNKLGRSGLPLVVFSRSYTTGDVPEHQTEFVEEVAAQAPRARGDDIRACSAPLSRQFPHSLLAYGALAEFEDRGDILVLAYAWTDEDSGPLEQSMVWAWSIGDCDGIPVHYSKSVIRPQR